MNIYPLGGSLTYPILIASVLFGLLIWGTLCDKKLSGAKKWILFSLRAVTILLLFWILLRPSAVTTTIARDASSVIVLLDETRSMSVPDANDAKQSRFAAAKSVLTSNQDAINSLNKELDLKFYSFDSGIRPVTSPDGKTLAFSDQPMGEQTALGKVLDDLIRQEAGKRILGVFLLTDGAQRLPAQNASQELAALPQTAAQTYKRLGIPIFPLCFGQPVGNTKIKDVSIVNLNVPPRVFLKSAAQIEAQIRVDGLTNVDIPVRLLFETSPGKMEEIAQTVVRAETSGQVLPVSFVYEPKSNGEFKVAVDIPTVTDEQVKANNSMDGFIQVVDGGLKILYIEGAIRPEQKFICRAFEDSPYAQTDVIRINRLGTNADTLLETLEQGEYDVIILGDVHASVLPEDVQNKIVELVRAGTGLFLMGGFNAYGPGGYALAPLNVVIPVVMDKFERQNPTDAPASDLHIDKPIRLTLTGQGKISPILALRDSNPLGVWKQLPALDGANKWLDVKPGADVLATSDGKDPAPILVSTQVGKGRVLAFAADSTWRWPLAGFGSEHQRFWVQSVFWLAQKDKVKDARVEIKVDKQRVPCGGEFVFTANAFDSDGAPLEPSCFKILVKKPDGKKVPVPVVKNGDQIEGIFKDLDLPGDYQYAAVAVQNDENLGMVQGRVQAFKQDVELDDPAADPETLKQIAALTAGKLLAPDQLPDELSKMAQMAKTLEIRTESPHSLWDSFWILLLMIQFMSIEWGLRKLWTNV